MKNFPTSLTALIGLTGFSGVVTILFALACAGTVSLGSPTTADAEDNYISPELISVSTPVYRPKFADFDPPLGRYNYTVSWQGIPAASAELTLREQDGNYRVSVSARTYSGIELFYKLRYNAENTMSALDLSPHKTVITHQENSKIKEVTIDFLDNGEVYAKRVSKKDNDVKELRFDPKNFMTDPFSAAFLARSLPWVVGETYQFDSFNGKSRYLISLTAVERTTIEFQDKEVPVIVVSPRVRNLTSKVASKLNEAKIYITDDKHRDILRIESSVFIGTVTTELEKFTPSEVNSTLRLAQLKREEGGVR